MMRQQNAPPPLQTGLQSLSSVTFFSPDHVTTFHTDFRRKLRHWNGNIFTDFRAVMFKHQYESATASRLIDRWLCNSPVQVSCPELQKQTGFSPQLWGRNFPSRLLTKLFNHWNLLGFNNPVSFKQSPSDYFEMLLLCQSRRDQQLDGCWMYEPVSGLVSLSLHVRVWDWFLFFQIVCGTWTETTWSSWSLPASSCHWL